MKINTDNEKKIDAYARDHKDCRQPGTEKVYIQDERQNLDIYRLPTELVFFNIRNGRFAAEYKALVEKLGRHLKSEEPEDAKQIEKLLLEQDPKQTTILAEDLRRFKQKDPGIITHDGYLINGNRRLAVLNTLKTPGNDEYGYIIVARLPKQVSEKDLWKIEAGIQLSRKEKLDYGPINTLLKFKEGIDAGLKPAQIASSLYGGFTKAEIEENLKRLALIEQWLEFIGHAGNHKKAEGVHEHFIVLRKIIEKQRNKVPPETLLTVQKIAFELIAEQAAGKKGGVTQMELRKINKIVEEENVKKKLLTAEKYVPKKHSQPIETTTESAEYTGEEEEEGTDAPVTKVKTIFNESVDMLKAIEEREMPGLLLSRALTNLQAIDLKSPHLKESEVKQKIKEIASIVEKLKSIR